MLKTFTKKTKLCKPTIANKLYRPTKLVTHFRKVSIKIDLKSPATIGQKFLEQMEKNICNNVKNGMAFRILTGTNHEWKKQTDRSKMIIQTAKNIISKECNIPFNLIKNHYNVRRADVLSSGRPAIQIDKEPYKYIHQYKEDDYTKNGMQVQIFEDSVLVESPSECAGCSYDIKPYLEPIVEIKNINQQQLNGINETWKTLKKIDNYDIEKNISQAFSIKPYPYWSYGTDPLECPDIFLLPVLVTWKKQTNISFAPLFEILSPFLKYDRTYYPTLMIIQKEQEKCHKSITDCEYTLDEYHKYPHLFPVVPNCLP